MNQIISKRHPGKFYVPNLIILVIFNGIGLVLGSIFLESFPKDEKGLLEFALPLVSLLCFFTGWYTVFRNYKNVPIITLNSDQIKFNNEIHLWQDIETIELTGKKPYASMGSTPTEGAAIKLKDGETKYIFDDMYSNSHEIKSFLHKMITSENIQHLNTSVPGYDMDMQSFEIFRGNQFISFRGILLWGMIIMLIILLSGKKPPMMPVLMFFAIISLFWFFIHSYAIYYVSLSDKYLCVKNHNFLWVNKIYRLDEIKVVVFERTHNSPYSFRVITKDYKSDLYAASTLREKTWMNLKNKLEAKGVSVRNECIPVS